VELASSFVHKKLSAFLKTKQSLIMTSVLFALIALVNVHSTASGSSSVDSCA